MFVARDILRTAIRHRGEQYVLGAIVPLGNRAWRGPWDCAEFVAWCTYQTYGIIFAVRPPHLTQSESYSGWWFEDGRTQQCLVDAGAAMRTAGAILVRAPGAFGLRVGHVAISCGDGTTIEANSRDVGVDIIPNVDDRPWSAGLLIPGVQYPTPRTGAPYVIPQRVLMVRNPFMRGPAVRAVQQALAANGIHPGRIDGVYGPNTATAVASFQASRGLVVDGMVGEQTAGALGLNWPI